MDQALAGLEAAVKHLLARPSKHDIPISVVSRSDHARWLEPQDKRIKNWLEATQWTPEAGQIALVPEHDGTLARVVLGLGDGPRSPWSFAALVGKLPAGRYAFDDTLAKADASSAALGWALATYRFTRYRAAKGTLPSLVWPKGADRHEVTRVAGATFVGRDLVNVPTEDLGPEELVAAGLALAEHHGAETVVIAGDDLLARGYPAVHAVGRACSRAPRLFDMRWGDAAAPRLTLVGKGVCFDTGGLDLKPAASMRLMKKDMGGAASVFALAHLVMDARLPVRLRVLVPAVENSVAGNALRPGDVLSTRKGLTVEIGNTDAEGRLILCDALAEADSEEPDLLIDFATLTGAARVALGTELPALFCNDDAFANQVLAHGRALHDPLWPLPLFDDYRRHLESSIADLGNASNIAYAGAITAALFLREFVGRKRVWAHIDTMAWNSGSRPGRPTGGELFGVRAVYAALRERYAA